MTFQSRFNRIIAAAYGVLCLSALVLFGFLYQENLERQVSLLRARLSEETQSLDHLLRIRYDAVNSARYQMEDYLKHNTFDVTERQMNFKTTYEEGYAYFHQDEPFEKLHRIGNITGLGNPKSFSLNQWKEIKAAYALNPLFRILKKNIVSFVNASYTSINNFQNLYPWVSSKRSRFHPCFYQREFFQRALPEHNDKREIFWSDTYLGPRNQWMQTCATPVYYYDRFMGVISIDFTLKAVDKFLDNLYYPQGRVLIINEHQRIIRDSFSKNSSPATIIKTSTYLPHTLSLKKILKIPPFTVMRINNYWVYRANLKYAPWSVIYYVKSRDLTWTALKEIGPGVILVLLFASIFLIFARQLILREFIAPAQRLIRHIANQGQTKDDFTDIPHPWYSWFEAVSVVFDENKKLVHKLEEHIHELDLNVIARTKAISQNNKALQKAVNNLKNAQNQIIVQEKMAGLGAITAGIAHEIKNPLNFILNFAVLSREFLEELTQEIKKAPSIEEDCQPILMQLEGNLQKIESHAKRADSIVRSMLLHARGGDDTPQPTEINSLLDENALLVLSSLRQRGSGVTIKKDFDPALPVIMAYRQDLSRVFLNLINNSCYAVETRQKLEPTTYEPLILLKTSYDDTNVHICIHDNGTGISAKVKKEIFNPFFTTKPAGSGTGLGLSLSYDIITNQHQGKITVESQEGVFTEFHIMIPLSQESSSLG